MIERRFYKLLDLEAVDEIDEETLRQALGSNQFNVYVRVKENESNWWIFDQDPSNGSTADSQWERGTSTPDELPLYLLTGWFGLSDNAAWEMAHGSRYELDVAPLPNAVEGYFTVFPDHGSPFNLDSLWITAEDYRAITAAHMPELDAKKAIREKLSRPLATKERATLLVIVEALARESNVDTAKISKAGDAIAAMTESFAPVSTRAIQDHLRQIPDAVERKSKTSR